MEALLLIYFISPVAEADGLCRTERLACLENQSDIYAKTKPDITGLYRIKLFYVTFYIILST